MNISRITTRGRTTIPVKIREAANLAEGDMLAFEVEGDCVLVRKLGASSAGYLSSLSGILDEWMSPEDEEAWGAL